MSNCIKADLRRVLKKGSYILLAGIQLLLIVGAGVLAFFFHSSGIDETFDAFTAIALLPLIFLVGVPVFLAVFSDDFKSHAMQVSIGHGLSRRNLVFCRFLEVVIIIVQTFFVYSLVIFGLSMWLHVSMDTFWTVMENIWESALKLVCYCAISMIVVFATQRATLGLVLFILFSVGTVAMALTTISMVPFFAKHNIDLSVLSVEGLMDLARDPSKAWHPLIWVGLVGGYIVLPVWLSVLIFRHKELEF